MLFPSACGNSLCLFPKAVILPSLFQSWTFPTPLLCEYIAQRSLQPGKWLENPHPHPPHTFFSLIKIAKMVFSADCDATNGNNEKRCKVLHEHSQVGYRCRCPSLHLIHNWLKGLLTKVSLFLCKLLWRLPKLWLKIQSEHSDTAFPGTMTKF